MVVELASKGVDDLLGMDVMVHVDVLAVADLCSFFHPVTGQGRSMGFGLADE